MPRQGYVVLGIILLLALIFGVWRLAATDEGQEPAAPDPEQSGEPLPPAAGGGEDSEADPAPPDGGETPGDEEQPTAGGTDPASGREESGAGEAPEGDPEEAPPPAIRRNPRTPPPPKPSIRPGGGGRPPMGPTGLWEKFPPEVPRGTAALEAWVKDSDGNPVAGADVYIGPPEIAGNPAVSFGDLRKVGKTDSRGRVWAGRLPEGSAAVAANLDNLLNGRRGLDATTAVRTVLEPKGTAEVEVTLPFSLREFGSIRGTVVDADGEPIRNARVTADFSVSRTKADGKFLLPRLRPGTKFLSASRSGYAGGRLEVALDAGGTEEVEVVLEYREQGSLNLKGTVAGPEGEAVPGANVYLMAQVRGGRGTIRSVQTDEAGHFRMDSLPDRLAETDVRIQASKMGYGAAVVTYPDGLNVAEVDLRMPERMVRLKLAVTDSKTGDPMTRCRFEAKEEETGKRGAGFSSRSETGDYETWIRPGRYEFLVEAPDHEPHTAVVELSKGTVEYPYPVRLVASGEAAKEVVLTVSVVSATTREPIERAKVEVLPRGQDAPIATLEGERPGGQFVLPVPSGEYRIRVTARDHQQAESEVELSADPPEVLKEIQLYPE